MTPAKVLPEKIKQEGLALISPLQPLAERLVIHTDADYQAADSLLGRVMAAKKTWLGRMNPIIEPIYQGLQGLYILRSDVEKPLTEAETLIKRKMLGYQTVKARLLEEAETKRIAEATRLQREIEAKQAAAASAKTPQMQGKLLNQQQKLVEDAVALESVRPLSMGPVKAAGSSLRKKKVPMVEDLMDFAAGIVDGTVPLDCIMVNERKLADYYKEDADTVAKWPGVIITDVDSIAGRAR